MFALQSSSVVVNAIVSFIQPAEMHRSEEQVPGSAGQRLKPDGQRGQDVRDVDPALLPADAAIGRHPANLEVLDGTQAETGITFHYTVPHQGL
jgi:hypothetical protein